MPDVLLSNGSNALIHSLPGKSLSPTFPEVMSDQSSSKSDDEMPDPDPILLLRVRTRPLTRILGRKPQVSEAVESTAQSFFARAGVQLHDDLLVEAI